MLLFYSILYLFSTVITIYCDIRNGLHREAELGKTSVFERIVEEQDDESAVRTLISGCDRKTVLGLIRHFDVDAPVQNLLRNRLRELGTAGDEGTMQTYSIVFLDIDGTLLDSQHQIMSQTKQLLNRLEKRGIPIILCSARSPGGVETVVKQAELHSPVVCYGGGLILDRDRSILRDVGIESGLTIKLCPLILTITLAMTPLANTAQYNTIY